VTTPSAPESLILESLLARLHEFDTNLPVQEPSVPFVPPDDRRYLRVQLLPGRTQRTLIPSDAEQLHVGILQVTVNWSTVHGEVAPRELAGQIASHFAVDQKLPAGDSFVRITQRPSVGPSLPDGADLLTPVSVFYESYI
jgi:hypothetical protein